MKNLIYLVIVLFLILQGCSKESEDYGDLKKAKVPVPIKVAFCATPDMTIPPVACAPVNFGVKLSAGARISGTGSHLGEIIPEKSYTRTNDCFLDGQGHIVEHCYGEITADNGDSFSYTNEIVVSMADFSFTGTINMDGGNGRFEGVKGLVHITGNVNPQTGVICWTGTGEMWYDK